MRDQVRPIQRALISVSDKSNLAVLAEGLKRHGVEVLSTGGTARALLELGVNVVKVSDYTGAPEILGGRVKTLHPKIHGGILALPTAAHVEEAAAHDIPPIDLVVVNLYPFEQTIARPDCTYAEAVEQIDIGGPTMVRSAAKNWTRVAVVVNPCDYAGVVAALDEHDGGLDDCFRRRLSREAFMHTAAYDAAISSWMSGFDDEGAATDPDGVRPWFAATGAAVASLRYGENPHQPATFVATDYARHEPTGLDRAVVHQGKALSYNNLLDADAALGLIRDLAPVGRAAAVFKHLSPCGAAVDTAGKSMADVYVAARQADAESAFGGIVSLTDVVDEAVAERLLETFLEVVVASGYTPGALELLSRKKNLRLLEIPEMFSSVGERPPLRVRSVAGGLLVQREDLITVAAAEARVATKLAPSTAQLESLDLAQRVCKHVKSNAVVLVRDGVTVGVGGGQTSRVEAVRQAIARAGEAADGAVLASDAFFPFRDSIDHLATAGVCGIIQPGGSKRDGEVIEAADAHGMTMVFTGQRHFRH